MGLCKGLGAIYSGSYGESALLIVRAKGEWKMCLLPLQSRLWGRGLLLETPGAGTSPHTSSLTRATVICTTAEPGIKGLPRATGHLFLLHTSLMVRGTQNHQTQWRGRQKRCHRDVMLLPPTCVAITPTGCTSGSSSRHLGSKQVRLRGCQQP